MYYANPKEFCWKEDLKRNKIVYLQSRYPFYYQTKILTGKVKFRRYSDRNYNTFLFAAMRWFTGNRIYARQANEDERKRGADLIAVVSLNKIPIKLNPLNNKTQIIKTSQEQREPGLLIAESMEHLTGFFRNIN